MRFLYFVLTLTVCSSLFSEDVVGEDKISKEAKYYDRINEHLLKEVNTDDVEANMAELKRWFSSKRTLLNKGSGIWPVIEQVLNMDTICMNYTRCDTKGYKLLIANNDGLMSASRLSENNYSLQRTDKLVHHFFTKFASLCNSIIPHIYNPSVGFGWKRVAYRKIDDYVKQHSSDARDTENTMNQVKELLVRLERENKDGAMTDAARQIVSMDSKVLGDDRCTYKAYEILRSNEAAVFKFSQQVEAELEHLYNLVRNRVDQHANICRDVYPTKFRAKIAQLDERTLRTGVILASEYYFRRYTDQGDNIAESIDHSKYLEINPDFTAPEVVELITKTTKLCKDIRRKDADLSDLLPLQLRLFVTDSQPGYQKLYDMRSDAEEPEIERMFTEIIIEPCIKFKEIMNDVLLPATQSPKELEHFAAYYKGSPERIGFLLSQTAMNLCNFATSVEDFDMRIIVNKLKK